MARSIAFHFHHLTALKALTVLSVIAVLVPNRVQGRLHWRDCPSFSCGPLRDVSSPFRQASDPPWCGFQSYELVCSATKATIRINNATYHVSRINLSHNGIVSYFWVVDAVLDLPSQCPLPQWNRPFYEHKYGPDTSHPEGEVVLLGHSFASFVRCSQEVGNNGMYMPVTCMSTSYSFVYVLTGIDSGAVGSLEPSCGYLAMTPLGTWDTPQLANASYADTIESMRNGFTVRFPVQEGITECLTESIRELGEVKTVKDLFLFLATADLYFGACAIDALLVLVLHKNFRPSNVTAGIMWLVKWIAVICRFMLAPLAVLIFLTHKYWKTRITIDAVEKFLRMQQMVGPMRYAYTDITAVTSHFRDKLGQGGYGSVFKGVLLPGNVHVAVKMLEGNASCNGEDFISEVSTIGRIHHINVVRLMGFCSEEMRRALVYEYMPRGSLDKGIDYLHQGCEMQILHFDIKPHNILLDSNFIPKVADFGLAKLYPRDNSFLPSRALRGTIGYIAPEMISRSFGVISSKSDVYSFGMLLLEMAGGRRNADPNAANSSQAYYPSWVYDRLIQQENIGEISAHVDTEMHELERKLCIIGLWCIQMKCHDRPTMSEVIEMLEGGGDTLQMPSRPFFCDDGHAHTKNTYHLSSELTEISQEDMSENIGV
ncbi:LEAF RUST 10 DISEASE-RESISTANCE LOCUS RECEPTOR-LIKE PROTEIN KINASE-like 2.4 [Hordeum vulgare subsp. vulgare]|uniref:LEAF RUST 10 DISEASE-RESISTANCE LOCUS RECEPTOR-LIKE PROTEIN KINASE-like 2.4 n=1 Tax=Hordeum vulgare subsp. vulgare TaxID=112509 RepID=UPI001D1A551C|nr:LEAF RUST 10 DISEASE-RESISTANCE LOCUS RECEPTOR-LIKE PROTEIN KINASE-like 2.4 [Hordeum vulgare subsp. vulgare]